MTGHVLDVAWLCPCGQRVPAGETVHPWGEAWCCAACLPAPEVALSRKPEPAAEPAPPRRRRTQTQRDHDKARSVKQHPPYNLTGLPGPARQTTRRTRKAKATTLEELLGEW